MHMSKLFPSSRCGCGVPYFHARLRGIQSPNPIHHYAHVQKNQKPPKKNDNYMQMQFFLFLLFVVCLVFWLIKVAVIRRQISKSFFLFFSRYNCGAICQGTGTFPVLEPERHEVGDAESSRKAEEGQTDNVPWPVEGCIFLQERVCGNDSSDWFHVSDYTRQRNRNEEYSLLPNPICHAVPMLRRRWPPKFIVNQHTMTGIAL